MYRILLLIVLLMGAGAASAQQPDIKLPKLKGKKFKEPKIKERVKAANKKVMTTTPAEGSPAAPAGLTVTEEGVEENKEKKKKREEQ